MTDALCLLDLPAEVLCYIVNLLDHPRDVAACIGASAALAYASPLDVATFYYRGRSEAALASGLPLSIARVLFGRWAMAPECRHIPAAAAGGHADVIRWVCCHTENKSGSLLPSWTMTTVCAPPNASQYLYAPGPDPMKHPPLDLRDYASFDSQSSSDSSLPGSPLPQRPPRQEAATARDSDSRSALGSDSPPAQRRTPDARVALDRSTDGQSRPAHRRRRRSAWTLNSSSSSEDEHEASFRCRTLLSPFFDDNSNPNLNSDPRTSEDEHETAHTKRTAARADVAVERTHRTRTALDTSSESTSPFMTPRPWHTRSRPSPSRSIRHSRVLRVNGGPETASYLFKAVGEAARLGHVDVLRYLTVSCPLAEMPSALLDEHVVIEAARRGTLATVAYAHDRWSQSRSLKSEHPCRCSKQIAEVALAAGQRDLLRWMRTVGCAAFPCDLPSLARAVGDGSDVLVDAITDALAPDGYLVSADVIRQFDDWVDPRVLTEAARKGHVRALAIAHARGFAPFTPALLAAAAAGGRLDILRWAAGETVASVEPRFAPLERLPWDDPMVAWHAAGQREPDVNVLDWLAAHPETRRHFDAVMARTLLVRDRPHVVIWMHDSGLVPVSSWNSLEVAIQAGIHRIEALIDRGAECSPRAMAAALVDCSDDSDRLIAILCRHYGYADLRVAVQFHVHAVNTAAVRWVRDNVPDVSVEHILRAERACPLWHGLRLRDRGDDDHDRSWGTSE